MIVKHNKTWNRRKKLDTEQWSPQRISTHLNCSMHGECYTQDCTRTTFSAFGVWNLTTWAAIQLQFWHHINANPQMICNILFLDKLHFTVPKTPIYGITIINMGQSKVTSSDCTTCGNIWQVTPLSTFWDIIRQASAGQSKSDELRLYNLRKHLTGDSSVNFLRHHPPGFCWTVKKWRAQTVQLAETSDRWLLRQLFETSSARRLLDSQKVMSSDCTTCRNIWQVTPMSTFWDIIRQASAGQSKSDELGLYNLQKHLTGDSHVNFLKHHPPGFC